MHLVEPIEGHVCVTRTEKRSVFHHQDVVTSIHYPYDLKDKGFAIYDDRLIIRNISDIHHCSVRQRGYTVFISDEKANTDWSFILPHNTVLTDIVFNELIGLVVSFSSELRKL